MRILPDDFDTLERLDDREESLLFLAIAIFFFFADSIVFLSELRTDLSLALEQCSFRQDGSFVQSRNSFQWISREFLGSAGLVVRITFLSPNREISTSVVAALPVGIFWESRTLSFSKESLWTATFEMSLALS